jgi:hypothetical protein
MAVINPADKARFGEDSTLHIYANAKKAAEETGLTLEVTPHEAVVGHLRLRYVDAPWRPPPADTPPSHGSGRPSRPSS